MEYNKLADFYEKIENISGKIEKTEVIADFINRVDTNILPILCKLIQGKVFADWETSELGFAIKMMIKAITISTGFHEDYVVKLFNETGDLGKTAEELIKRKKQQTLFRKKLDVVKVFNNLKLLPKTEGEGSVDRKIKLVVELLSSAEPKEARYIVRSVLEELRVGVAEGILRDAIAKAFFVEFVSDVKKAESIVNRVKGKTIAVEKNFPIKENKDNNFIFMSFNEIKDIPSEKNKCEIDYVFCSKKKFCDYRNKEIINTIEWAWFLRSDYGEIASIAKRDGLEGLRKVNIKIGNPVHVLLAEKAKSLEDAINTYERVAIEIKYDGMRAQIHKNNRDVWIFTRRLENVTKQFPEIVDMVKKNVEANTCIIEGEVIGIDKNNKPLPFQVLSQRIHRKYDIDIMVEKIPTQVNLFDIIYLNGEMLFNRKFEERRRILRNIINIVNGKFQLAEQIVGKDIDKARKFYEDALKNGQEGVMVKNLDAFYQPGRRVAGGWLKVKPVMETLDLVIVGAEWGTGKRAGWFSSFVLACRDPVTGNFLECGMMGTGVKEKKTSIKDITFQDLTNILKKYIEKEEGKLVKIKPKLVVEIAYEEIQKSSNYTSGYALRFPRLVRIREDKGSEDIDTIDRIKNLYNMQRGRKTFA